MATTKVSLQDFLSMFSGGKGYVNGKEIKKIYFGKENFTPRNLPEGYTQVEYIQSSGTQYIDTGFKPNQDTRVVMDAQLNAVPSAHAFLFGGRTGSGSNSFTFLWYATPKTFRADYGVNDGGLDSSVSATSRLKLDYNKNIVNLNGTVYSHTYQTFASPANMTLFCVNSNGTKSAYASMKLYSLQIYDNGVLARDYVPCKNSSGVAGLFDMVNSAFYQNAGTGTFTVGATQGSTAIKLKKLYVGEDGIARLLCKCSGELKYYGKATALQEEKYGMGATTVGDYAVIAGGYITSSEVTLSTVEAYNKSLTKTIATSLSSARYGIGATSVGDYALFAGGILNSTVDAYNKSLTRSTPTALSSGRSYPAATTIGNYALFGGGDSAVAVVDAYNKSLTRSTPTALSQGRTPAATTVGNYALFGGGHGTSRSNLYTTVDTYNASLTRGTATALGQARRYLSATSVGNYALFGGGLGTSSSSSYYYTNVDAYDSLLTRTTPTALSVKGYNIAATTLDDYALFGNGVGRSTTVDCYDSSLTRTIPTALSSGRQDSVAVTIGDYALFAGGQNSSVVEAYTLV